MRLIAEILVVALLIGAGWNKTFRDWVGGASSRRNDAAIVSKEASTAGAQPQLSPTGTWMWEKTNRAALERPTPDPKQAKGRYVDSDGRRYWIDNRGQRQYDK